MIQPPSTLAQQALRAARSLRKRGVDGLSDLEQALADVIEDAAGMFNQLFMGAQTWVADHAKKAAGGFTSVLMAVVRGEEREQKMFSVDYHPGGLTYLARA